MKIQAREGHTLRIVWTSDDTIQISEIPVKFYIAWRGGSTRQRWLFAGYGQWAVCKDRAKMYDSKVGAEAEVEDIRRSTGIRHAVVTL